MRISIDAEVAAKIQRMAEARHISFEEALDDVLRAGLASQMDIPPYKVRPRHMGLRPGIDLDKALRLSSELEDEETIRSLDD